MQIKSRLGTHTPDVTWALDAHTLNQDGLRGCQPSLSDPPRARTDSHEHLPAGGDKNTFLFI